MTDEEEDISGTFKTVNFFEGKSDDGINLSVDEDEETVKVEKYKTQEDTDEFDDFVEMGELGEEKSYPKGMSQVSEKFFVDDYTSQTEKNYTSVSSMEEEKR